MMPPQKSCEECRFQTDSRVFPNSLQHSLGSHFNSAQSTTPLIPPYFLYQHTRLPNYSNSHLTLFLQSVDIHMGGTKAHSHHKVNMENHVKYIPLNDGSIRSIQKMQGSKKQTCTLKFHTSITWNPQSEVRSRGC
jgi:hypothetical protein